MRRWRVEGCYVNHRGGFCSRHNTGRLLDALLELKPQHPDEPHGYCRACPQWSAIVLRALEPAREEGGERG